ncbi:PR-1 protein [Mucidula mucida]|nr:PR-1 protein [Mucidula mucida]
MFFSKTLIALSFAAALSTANMVARDAKDDTIAAHNVARAEYGASALTWNDDLYAGTQSWANTCQSHHSGGNYGENLYSSTGQGGNSIQSAVDSWMSEASKYDYNNPVFSSDTGHFTQVVWQSTTSVACAVAQCDASQFVVCGYSPSGNVQGQFDQDVGRHV